MSDEADGEKWKLLDQAVTPAEVVKRFQDRGIDLSERTLREFARRQGACRIIGKTMFLMPSDIDAILEASQPQPKAPPTLAKVNGHTAKGRVSREPDQRYEELLRARLVLKNAKDRKRKEP